MIENEKQNKSIERWGKGLVQCAPRCFYSSHCGVFLISYKQNYYFILLVIS